MINVGVIGCGGITAFAHIPEILNEIRDRKDIKIVGLCDKEKNRVDVLKRRYNLYCDYYSDYEQIISDNDIDALIVAAWPTNNCEIAIKALKAHKHVLLQKPLVYNEELMNELFKVAESSDNYFMALPYIESVSLFREIKEVIQSGCLGNIRFVRIRTTIIGPDDYYNDVSKFFHGVAKAKIHPNYLKDEYANKRGCFSDMGPYSLSLYHYLFGEAQLKSCFFSHDTYEKSAIVALTPFSATNNKTPELIMIESGWFQVPNLEMCVITGTEGSICLKTDGELIINCNSDFTNKDRDNRKIQLLPISPYIAQSIWLNAILDKTPKKEFDDSIIRCIWVSKIIDKAYSQKT